MFLLCILKAPSGFPLKTFPTRVAFNFNYNFIMIANCSFLCHISNGPLFSPVKTLSHTHTLTRRHTAKGFTRWQSSFTVKQIEKLFPFARKKLSKVKASSKFDLKSTRCENVSRKIWSSMCILIKAL